MPAMDSAAPRITVAIPFHSGVGFLPRALASVLGQRDPRWELIVCDDSGNAEVAGLIAAQHDARVRYHHNDVSPGMVGNWNRCLELARTDLVVLLHEDDELLPGYTELMLRAAERQPTVGLFFCAARIIDAAGAARFSFPDLIKRWIAPVGRGAIRLHGDQGLAALLRGNFLICPTACYRKSLLAGRRFTARWSFAQDLAFFAQWLLDGQEIVCLREEAYAYRRHGNNATARYTANMLRFREELAIYSELATAAAAQGWQQSTSTARRKTMVKLNLGFSLLLDLCRGQPQRAAQKLACLWEQ